MHFKRKNGRTRSCIRRRRRVLLPKASPARRRIDPYAGFGAMDERSGLAAARASFFWSRPRHCLPGPLLGAGPAGARRLQIRRGNVMRLLARRIARFARVVRPVPAGPSCLTEGDT